MSLIDLGTRCLLEIHGPDAVRYLNGQVTQDVRSLAQDPTSALPACVTDAKGRLQGYVTLYQIKDSPLTLWVEAPLELRDLLLARLSRYLIADDAEIEDRTDDYRLLHCIGDTAEPGDFSHERYGVPGSDRWMKAGVAIEPTEFLSQERVEAIRVKNGVPLWGRELVEGMLPPEARLDRMAISYQKGCYIGQEVISRIKSAGKLNRMLMSFLLETSASVPSGTTLLDDAGVDVGELTSVAYPHALGYLHKKGFGKTTFSLAGLPGNCRCRE
jgi:folate-binding protein YgfZ